MNVRLKLSVLTLLLVLSACGQSNPTTVPKNHLGMVEITFNGIGTKNLTSSARAISGLGSEQMRTITDVANGIQLRSVSRGSFDVGTRGAADGMRYLSATYKVRNAEASCTPTPSCTPTAYPTIRHNLSFIAVSTSTTLNNTAVANMKLFNGSLANPVLAQNILPTHGMDFDRLTLQPKVALGGEDFQAFNESEVSSLATTLGAAVTSVFPFGYVTRCVSNCTPGTRDLAANPAPTAFDGSVTFAAKLPLQPFATDDPFSFSLLFEIVEDSTTRVTQSLEEQTTPSAVAARAAALTGGQVFTLPGVSSPSTCSVRTAGTVASPLAYLVNSVALSATPSLANQMFAAAGATVTAPFGQAMNPGTSSNFSVQGLMTGKKSGTYTAPANDLSFAPTTATRPGEELEVTLTNGVSSTSGLSLCPSYTFQYRTAVTLSSLGTFGAGNNYSVNLAYSVAVGDINGDGNLDIINTNYNSNNVTVRYGNGLGAFLTQGQYSTDSLPYSVTVGDVNNDGLLDILISTYNYTVSVLINNGSGFNSPVNYATGTLPSKIITGDVNSDGYLDVITANTPTPPFGTISVLLNNGNGTFQTAVNYPTLDYAYSVAVGDVNNDGKLDLLNTNYATNNVSVRLGVGGGSFQTAINYPTAPFPNSITIGDVNGDGNLDLVTANSSSLASVLLGNGNGSFLAPSNYAIGAGPNKVKLADVNGDRKLDLLTSNYNSGTVSVLFGDVSGTFLPAANTNTGSNPGELALGDLNNDGKLDLITANEFANNISVLTQP